MLADRVVIEVIEKIGIPKIFHEEYEKPQDFCDIHADLWRRVGRMPVACYLSDGTARVIFQSGRRATDTLDNLGYLVRIALEG